MKDAEGSKRGTIPLIVAVTGHIDLRPQDYQSLRARVRAAFEDLQRRAPHTPIVLLSGLAEGADRLVAQVALELKIGLVATLPMPRHLYERDFLHKDADDREDVLKTEASRAEFAALLGQARRCIELPLLPGVTEAEIRTNDEARKRQYEALAALLVTDSHLVLALWNSVWNGATGGTSEVVRFALDGVPARLAPTRDPLTETQVQPVLQIVTARTTKPTAQHDLSTVWRYPPSWGSEPEGKARFVRQLSRLDALNADADRLSRPLAARRAATEQDLIPDADAARLPPDVLRARATFAVVDALAVAYRDRARRAHYLLVGLLFLVGASLALYYYIPAKLFDQPLLPMTPDAEHLTVLALAVLNGAALILAILVYQVARRGDYFVKHQDYRALAEALRVTLFWLVAGIDAPVADQYLQKQRSELDWIRDALRAWRLDGLDAPGHPELPETERLTLVMRYWVQQQAEYYTVAAARYERIRRRQQTVLGPLIWVAFGFSVAWVVVMIVTSWRQWQLGLPQSERGSFGAIALVAGLAAVVAALLRDLTHTTAVSALVTQYRSMAALFGRAQRQLSETPEHDDGAPAREVLDCLGREALREAGDWLLMHRERQLKNPSGR